MGRGDGKRRRSSRGKGGGEGAGIVDAAPAFLKRVRVKSEPAVAAAEAAAEAAAAAPPAAAIGCQCPTTWASWAASCEGLARPCTCDAERRLLKDKDCSAYGKRDGVFHFNKGRGPLK